MKRSLGALAALIAVLAFAAVPAFAASAHFIGTPTLTVSSNGSLSVSGKAAGLGDGPVTAQLSADTVTQTVQCRNHGGNIAPGQGTSSADVTGAPVTIAPHNGQITFRNVTLAAPALPTAEQAGCPNGKWTVELLSLEYTNVVLTVTQGSTNLTYDFGDITFP
jgi:hypothetical protein